MTPTRLGYLILFGLFALAEFWNWQKGRDLARVCEIVGPFTAESYPARSPRQELANICLSHEGADER